jgi:Concanavalin A-like lectin/glucanases superfamily
MRSSEACCKAVGRNEVQNFFGASLFTLREVAIKIKNQNFQIKITSSYSITGWFKTNAPADYQVIFEKSTTASVGYYFGLYQGKAFIENDSTWTHNGNAIPDTKWHFMVGTYDGTNQRIYLDGVLGETQASGPPTDNTVIANIGTLGSGEPGYNFNGSLDDLRVYNRALSASEVKQLYSAGR